jgi:DNA-binding Lrp family transcriptional regulator
VKLRVVMKVDQLDVALLEALQDNPRVGDLELSRITKVARATVQSRLAKLVEAGVITGFGPQIDLSAAGNTVLAFVTLEISQGSLEPVRDKLEAMPNVLEAYVTTGAADVVCKIAATTHEDLQAILLDINRSSSVARSTSVVVLSDIVKARTLPMLKSGVINSAVRAPAYRSQG